MNQGATISDCGRYRYGLWRIWNWQLPNAVFIMLNPSTADAETDDPTIRRCVGFARSWDLGGVHIANLFALRASDPGELANAQDPIGSANDMYLVSCSRSLLY